MDSNFAINCRFLKILIIHKFNLNVPYIPKVILSEKIIDRNWCSKQFFVSTCNYVSLVMKCVPMLNVNFTANMFCKGVNHFLSMVVEFSVYCSLS